MVPDIAHLIKGSVFPILAAFKNEVVLSLETAALKSFSFYLPRGLTKRDIHLIQIQWTAIMFNILCRWDFIGCVSVA